VSDGSKFGSIQMRSTSIKASINPSSARDLDFVFDVPHTRWGRFKGQSNIRAYLDASPRWGKSSTGKLRKKNRSRRK